MHVPCYLENLIFLMNFCLGSNSLERSSITRTNTLPYSNLPTMTNSSDPKVMGFLICFSAVLDFLATVVQVVLVL